MAYKVTTLPATEVLSRSEVKNYLKVDVTTDDTLIDTLITAARQWIENHCALGLLPQTILETFDELPAPGVLRLGVSPVRDVSAITYLDTAGAEQTLSTSIYKADTVSLPARIIRRSGQTWPVVNEEKSAASAIYTVGYDNASAVPAPIRQAMLLTIADMYDNRTDYIKKLPTAAEYMLQAAGYRIWNFG